MMEPGSGNYSFASQPQAVRSRSKFREPRIGADGRMAINIMWDRRVVRGNTYAAQVLPAAALQDERTTSPGGSGRAPTFASGRHRGERLGTGQSDVAQEPVVECLLEEITDRPIEIDTISTVKVRNDDRPPSPIFVPQPRGIDMSTQVEDKDLFDFDVEVEPILQAIVGNTLEKSLAEVIEELDLEEELQAREVFELVRLSERLESERVQLKDVRQKEERERRQTQNVAREEQAKVSVKRSAASTFAHTYVGDVVSDVFDNLEGAGFFFDPLIREIEDTFLPWLEEGVHANIMMAQANEDAVTQVAVEAVALQEKRRNEAAAEHQSIMAALAKAAEDRVAEEARLQEELEAAAAVAADEARQAAEAEAAAAAEAEGAEGAAEGEGQAD